MQTTGHHTCSKRNGDDLEEVLKRAPFYSNYNETRGKTPFLGAGYYIWDYNKAMAHDWGKKHYHGNYIIIEFVLELPGEIFLDLVGNRIQMEYFEELIEKLEKSKLCRVEATIGEIIETLKDLEKDHPGLFPFKIIRAIDLLPKTNKYYFNEKAGNFTVLDPRLVICFLTKNELFFKSRKIIFSTE